LTLRSNTVEKIPWQGVLISVQPRIRLGRSFDRSHTYAFRVHGSIGGEAREFLVGVASHGFKDFDVTAFTQNFDGDV
jgi:hypothetical protein